MQPLKRTTPCPHSAKDHFYERITDLQDIYQLRDEFDSEKIMLNKLNRIMRTHFAKMVMKHRRLYSEKKSLDLKIFHIWLYSIEKSEDLIYMD